MKKKGYCIYVYNVVSRAELHIEASNEKEAREIANINMANLEFKPSDDCKPIIKIVSEKR